MRAAPQRERSRVAAAQILRARAAKMCVNDFERHECIVNSSEFAERPRDAAI